MVKVIVKKKVKKLISDFPKNIIVLGMMLFVMILSRILSKVVDYISDLDFFLLSIND